MKRLAIAVLLVAGCGAGAESWPDGTFAAGFPQANGTWLIPVDGGDRVTFTEGRYERWIPEGERAGCAESGTYAIVPSVDDSGDPATDVALTPAQGFCGPASFLRKGDRLLWLRPVPPETLFTAYRSR